MKVDAALKASGGFPWSPLGEGGTVQTPKQEGQGQGSVEVHKSTLLTERQNARIRSQAQERNESG